MKPLGIIIVSLALAVSAAAQTVWTLQPTSNGWQWVPPGGPPVCKYVAPSTVTNAMTIRSDQFPTMGNQHQPCAGRSGR